jgi:hypothetical protein
MYATVEDAVTTGADGETKFWFYVRDEHDSLVADFATREEAVRFVEQFLPTEFTVQVRVGELFYQDHVSRDLPAGQVVKVKNHVVTVNLNEAEFLELLNDAEFYVACASSFDWPELTNSAKRVAKALRNRLAKGDLPWTGDSSPTHPTYTNERSN